MRKNYILDTCVLIHDPNSIFNFEDNTVIIPIGVIEQLDKFKSQLNSAGQSAREVSRSLDFLCKKGDPQEGILSGNGIIKIRYNGNIDKYFHDKRMDMHVLHIARIMRTEEPETPCIVVSRDVNVRIRAKALGFLAEDYIAENVSFDKVDTGYRDLYLPAEKIDELHKQHFLLIDELDLGEIKTELYPNEYLSLFSEIDGKHSILGKVSGNLKEIVTLRSHGYKAKINPRNREQRFTMDALLDPDIKLVSVTGPAGTGKTLLAIAAGMDQVNNTIYERMLVSRPTVPMGKDLGYLPGTIDEKLDPWMQPLYDALDIVCNGDKNGGKTAQLTGKVVISPLAYIRGRSIHRQYLVVDEAQNLTPLELKTIITRAGEDTKVVLTGDVSQIDNPYINIDSNGLTYVMEAFKSEDLAAHIVMKKGERSRLAEIAAQKL